jgi:glucosamine kinase
MNFFLAVDAGGTKTDFLLADDTRELARVRGGCIKRMRVDAATAARNLDHALAELNLRSGISLNNIAGTCIGAAGETVPLVADWLREAFAARVSGPLLLLGDVEIALDAAFPGQPGLLVLAGTGSNVAGRSSNGVVTTAGGWGPVLADQGSGHRIGVEALRALFLARDEGRSTQLEPAILDFFHLASIDALVAFANAQPAPDFSSLARLTLHCATNGDAVANTVLQREGEALAYLAALIIRRLGHTSAPSIAFAGSVMENILPVRNALEAALRADFPAASFQPGVVDPIHGALWRARHAFASTSPL